MYQYEFDIETDRVISLSISGVALAQVLSGHDINLFLYIGDWLCGNNRALISGYEPTASASCTTPLKAGSYIVTFMTTSSGSQIDNDGYGLNASLVIH